MNNFFVNKVKVLRQNLPNDTGDPLALTRRLMSERQCSFKFSSVHPDEVNKIIENLKNSKSCGIDNIDTYIINPTSHGISESYCPTGGVFKTPPRKSRKESFWTPYC